MFKRVLLSVMGFLALSSAVVAYAEVCTITFPAKFWAERHNKIWNIEVRYFNKGKFAGWVGGVRLDKTTKEDKTVSFPCGTDKAAKAYLEVRSKASDYNTLSEGKGYLPMCLSSLRPGNYVFILEGSRLSTPFSDRDPNTDCGEE